MTFTGRLQIKCLHTLLLHCVYLRVHMITVSNQVEEEEVGVWVKVC